ncbi:BTB/POZ domain-containing protein 2 [Lepeophtheirus salmonis]|nr:BTB/POZ domain-containing protein 2-like [Lepeophtheirus salmonis]
MTSTVSVRIKGLFESGLFTDVSFLVGDNELQESLSAHRCILGGASPIFERMFGGNFRESNMKDMKILVLDVLPSAFKTMLKWIYTDEADLSLDNVAPVLYCAEKYQLSTLKYECISFIMKNFEIENLCQLFYQTRLHHVSELIPNMKICIGMNASRSLSSDSFLNIKHNEVLKDILSLDELDLDEIEVFKAALRWLSARKKEDNNVKKSMREIIGSALYSIRFPLLTADQFVNNVMPSGLLKDQEVLETLGLISKSKSTVPITLSIKPRIRHCYRF